MSVYKNYKEQYDILYRNVIETIKVYPEIDGPVLHFKEPIAINEGLFVLSLDIETIYIQDGTFGSTENWNYNDMTIRELLKILKQLESKNYD